MKRLVFKDIQDEHYDLLKKEVEETGASLEKTVESDQDVVIIDSQPEDNLANKALSLTQVENLEAFIEKGHYGQICQDILAFDFPQAIFKRFVTGDGALQIESSFSKGFVANRSLKILSNDGFGYYADLISNFARNYGFNHIAVRNSCVNFLSYIQYLEMEGIGSYPIEIDYGCSEESFFVQIHLDTENFYLQNVAESFHHSESMNPYSSLLAKGLSNSDLVEIYTLGRSQKLVICGLWLSLEKRADNFFPSLLIHQVPLFKLEEDKLLSEKQISKIRLKKELGGAINKNVGRKPSLFNSGKIRKVPDIFKIKRLQAYINRVKGKFPEGSDVKTILSGYKDQEEVQRLTSSELEVLEGFLLNKASKELDEVIEVVKGNFDDDSYLDGVTVVLDNLEVDDLDQVVEGVTFLDQEETHHVKGQKEDLGEETTLVKGSPDSSDSDDEYVVKGVTQHQKEEVWKVKRLDISNKAKNLITSMRGKGKSVQEIDQEIESLLEKELNIDSALAKKMSNVISLKVGEEISTNQDDSLKEIQNRIEIERLNAVLSKRDDQNRRMKRIIDGLKGSYSKLQAELQRVKSEPHQLEGKVDSSVQEQELDQEQENAFQPDQLELRIKELEEENKKVSRVAEVKERDIEMWKKKYFDLKGSSEDSETAQVERLNKEKDRLDQAMQKTNSKLQELSSSQNLEEALTLLKGVVSKSVLGEIEENLQVVKELENNDDEITGGDSEVEEGASRIELLEKQKEIGELSEALRKANDKVRTLNMSLKNFEQKNKLQASQIDKLTQELSKQRSEVQKIQNSDTKADQRVKLLEKQMEKLQDSNRKILNELGEKKTELHKSKLESKTMAIKMKDMEKKFNALKKRAA